MKSDWVLTEIRRALAAETKERRRKLFPIRLCDMNAEKGFPPGTQIEFEYVSEIKPQPSGKYVIVVNEINQEEGRLLDALDQ
jgi:hypothetical protein